MREDICSIPVNDVFLPKCGCPICRMRDTLETRMIDYILGAAMMEPDVRIKTNELGFCADHFKTMISGRNRLSLALILDSHLNEIKNDIFGNDKKLFKPSAKKSNYKSAKLLETCFVCDRVEWGMERLLATIYRLYGTELDFRKLFSEQEFLCLPHYNLLSTGGEKEVNKRYIADFENTCRKLTANYLNTLENDVAHFCKMFDYRNSGEDADWGNSKDSIERTINWLTGKSSF